MVTARNELATIAREIYAESLDFDPEFVITIDSDMWWPAGRVRECVTILQENPSVDMVAGIYTVREVGVAPKLFTFDPATPEAFTMISHELSKDGHLVTDRCYNPYRYRDGELTRLAFAEVGWAVMRRSLLSKVGPDPFTRILSRVTRFLEIPREKVFDRLFQTRKRKA